MMEENVSLTMVREHLQDIPNCSLPSAYSLRSYQPGDEVAWREIQSVADQYNTITNELFEHEFGNNEQMLAKRQFYLLDSFQMVVGTATAWFKDDYLGRLYGRVHWVAIVPEYQGLGLAKPLMTTICVRLRELGHERAYLTTSSARLAAINLYLQFGFVPDLNNPADQLIWDSVAARLGKHGSPNSLETT